jgi:multidrug efflux system outer membrane protein
MNAGHALKIGCIVSLAMTLAACSLVPTDGPPDQALPAQYSDGAGASATATSLADWWAQFDNPSLSGAIDAALAGNQDLVAALARIEQARATLRVAGAGRFPAIDASLGSNRTFISGDSFGGGTFGGGTTGGFGGGGFGSGTSHQASVSVSYEVDLFGRIRAQTAAAAERYSASRQDRAALELVTVADVADGFIAATSLRERLAIARANLLSNRQVLAIVEARLREGATSRLEVAQQRTTVANVEAAVAALEQQLRDSGYALAVLKGVVPDSEPAGAASLAALKLPAIAPGQPSLLLTRRPDLQRAEAELAAANADIGVARAAMLPRLSLSGSGNFGIDPVSTIGSLAAALAAPIFQGGRLAGEVERTRARRAELVANYRQAVLNATREVEVALNAVAASAKRRAALAIAADEAQAATRLARERYVAGRIDFLTLLNSQVAEFSAEDAHVDARRAEYSAAIALYRALGGGWSERAE